MFTGIITHLGKIKNTPEYGLPGQVSISVPEGFLDDTKIGDSIAVNGVCLTVIEFNQDANNSYFTVDISPETIDKTSFKQLQLNQLVNLEHSLKLGDSLDGHIVQGHVDCTIEVKDIINLENNKKIIFSLNNTENIKYLKYIAAKGSVSIDGVSLTVNEVVNNTHEGSFTVNIIPHTLEKTNLDILQIGESVNLEIDMFARYCVNFLENYNKK